MTIEMRKFQRPSGHLWPYLLSDGFPLILPNLWIDELGLSARPNTLEAYLRDISILYRWASETGISIEARLESLKGFSAAETRKIVSLLCQTRSGSPASQSTCARRLEAIRSFIDFAFDFFIESGRVTLLEQAQAERNRSRQLRKFAKQVASNANSGAAPIPSTDLSPPDIEILDAVLHPISELNPFRGQHVRMRNYCIFHVLLETLARRGELVLIELSDVDLGSKPTIKIKEAPVSARNKRRDGASLKTLGRQVPISTKLANLLENYICEVRDSFLRPRRPSAALFLSDRDGRRLSAYSVNHIMDRIECVPEVAALKKRVHPHGLRSTAANQVRRRIAQAGRSSGMELHESLSYLGGWVQGSPMVQRYTRSAISERLGEILRNEVKKPLKDE